MKIDRRFLALIILLVVGYLTQLHLMEVRGEEARRSLIAIEMLERDNFIVPTMHFWNYYNKPPLWNWVLAIFIHLFGSAQEWVVRLPGVLSILLTGGLIYRFTTNTINAKTGIFAALFYLTAVDLLYFGSLLTAEMDPFLTLLIFLQSVCIYYGFYLQRSYYFIPAWFFLSLGILTKSLPALVFFVFTFIGIAIVEKRWRWWFKKEQWLGFVILLGLIGGYLYRYHQQSDVFVYLAHSMDDAFQKSALEESSGIFLHLFTFPLNTIKITLPWSLFIFALLLPSVRKFIGQQPLLRFASIFIIANCWIYWLSPDTRNRYLYPFFPFIAILTAGIASYLIKNSTILSSLFLKKIIRQRNIIIVIGLLASVRLLYNFVILPIQAQHFTNRELAHTIVTKSNYQPIHLTGKPFIQVADPSIGNFHLQEIPTQLPPMWGYPLPYYIYLETGEVVKYALEPQGNQIYLVFAKDFSGDSAKILYRFEEPLMREEMLLMK